MIASSCKYESLASKETFNASVRHIQATIGLADRTSGGENLADVIDALVDARSISADEIPPFVSMLLKEKLGYLSAARNMASTAVDLGSVQAIVKEWNAFDIVVLYNHPDLGAIAINPKNPAHASRIDRMNKTELIVVYIGCFGKAFDQSAAVKAADAVISLYEGARVKENLAFRKGSCSYKAPAEPKAEKLPKTSVKAAKPKAAAASKGGRKSKAAVAEAPVAVVIAAPKLPVAPKPGSRMTPMYSVNVTNELFHNGNVEAWKRIIDSYKIKHADLDVLVYYDGERITNLNALFKWGKVKHGSAIQFAVAGENICDVAKLQRYLAQGASPMFEAFLRGPVNGVLSLF
ncbi:MAG: hypothetical protein CVV51_02665 [Spirochaetae bacterium HGW-Spirochaetae-7]|jgi:hypothetical protein|nr:MAG: hypothetical protein CVV51_02665 [Spirochaetae bacterium HGW-Spirochaetae-7]